MLRLVFISILFCSCSASHYYQKLLKKDPDFLKDKIRVEASVQYIHDTLPNGELLRVVNIPHITLEAPNKGFDRRIEKRLAREALKRERIERQRLKIVNDTLITFSKQQGEELRGLRLENNKLRTHNKKENRQNFWKGLKELVNYLPWILLVAGVIWLVSLIRKWIR